MSRLPRRLIALLLLLGVALSYSWMSPAVSAPNERSRAYLSLALLERGELQIGPELKTHGRVFDLSEKDGAFYTDKAPGSSFLALPVVALYKALDGEPRKVSIQKLLTTLRLGFMVPITLLTLALIFSSLSMLGIKERLRYQTVIALAMGTPLYHYGAAFYGHALVLCALSASCWAWLKSSQSESERAQLLWMGLASFCAGMCFFIEYQGAICCIAFAVAFLAKRTRWHYKPVLAAALGALPPVLATLGYNAVVFGGPFKTSYQYLAHASSAKIHEQGLFGITAPTLESMYTVLLSPARGLLWCAPIILLGCFGLPVLWKKARYACLFALISIALCLLITLGFNISFWGFGHRILIPIFGFGVLSAACLMEDLEQKNPFVLYCVKGAIALSILYNVCVSSAFPEFPANISSPAQSIAHHMATQGTPSPNIVGTLTGYHGTWSVAPLYLLAALAAALIMWPTQELARRVRVKSVVTSLCVLAVMGLALWSYPETRPKASLKKWQHWASHLTWSHK